MIDLINRLRYYGTNLDREDAITEIQRLQSVVSSLNAKCDHIGIRLGDVIRERDALAASIGAIHYCAHRTNAEDPMQLLRSIITECESAVPVLRKLEPRG